MHNLKKLSLGDEETKCGNWMGVGSSITEQGYITGWHLITSGTKFIN